MKTALVTLDYPPANGGVARYLKNLVLASNGEMDVFVPLLRRSRYPYWSQIFFMRSLRHRGYDRLLVSHALPVGTAAWFARAIGGPAYVVLMHGLDLRSAQKHPRKAWLLHRVLRGAKTVLANSAFVAREIHSFDPAITAHPITPGVEPLTFPVRSDVRHTFGISGSTFVILTVARLVSRKGIDTLLRVLPFFDASVRLVIVGDGPDRSRLDALAKRFGPRVTFVTNATDEERNRWYAAADLFAFLARDEGDDVEGFGIVCLEAALAGLPVLAGNSGGVSEAVVDGVTGLLVDPTDDEQIVSAIRRMINDPDLRERLGAAGRERAWKDFRWMTRWDLLKTLL